MWRNKRPAKLRAVLFWFITLYRENRFDLRFRRYHLSVLRFWTLVGHVAELLCPTYRTTDLKPLCGRLEVKWGQIMHHQFNSGEVSLRRALSRVVMGRLEDNKDRTRVFGKHRHLGASGCRIRERFALGRCSDFWT